MDNLYIDIFSGPFYTQCLHRFSLVWMEMWLSCRVMQLLVAQADAIETLSITNWLNEMVSGGMAFDDTWIPALFEANPLPKVWEITLRVDSDHYVEEGFLTKSSLMHLLQHASQSCPKLEKVVGEWTKVPDRWVYFPLTFPIGQQYFIQRN